MGQGVVVEGVGKVGKVRGGSDEGYGLTPVGS